jgi:hypothetical protein
LILLMVLLIAVANTSAFARGGKGRSSGHHAAGAHVGGHHFGKPRVGFGVFVAAPAFWYFPPLPYFPPIDALAAPVYIEQGSAPDLPAGYWYYCAEAKAYYPDVKECAGIWQPVAPRASQGQ